MNLGREHVKGEMLINVLKVGVGFEEMFHSVKDMLCRGTLTEDLCLSDINTQY